MGTKKYIEDFKKIDVDKNWGRFQKTVSQKNKDISRSQQIKVFSIRRIAAAILLLVSVGTIIYFTNKKTRTIHEIITQAEQKTEIILPDGSTIMLNGNSKLVYPEEFGKRKRLVKLTGEAYFEITKDIKKSFYIQLENTTVQVLGTSFNIKEEKHKQVTVHVISGKVSFYEAKNQKNEIKLFAGEKGVFNSKRNEFIRDDSKDQNFLFWKTGRLSFENTPITDVFKELEKFYNKKIVITDTSITKSSLTTVCEGQTFEGIIKELAILYDFDYEITGNAVYIPKNK